MATIHELAERARRNKDESLAQVISSARASDISYRLDAHEHARMRFDPKRYKRGGGYTPEEMAEIDRMAGVKAPTNDERSLLEQYKFMHTVGAPSKWTAYYDMKRGVVSTWMGHKLGDITSKGSVTTGFGGGKRQSIRVRGINGLMYSGICNLTGGDYCSLKSLKRRTA